MSDDFEDRPPSGTGVPTKEQSLATREYLLRRNRTASHKATFNELLANGFETSIKTVNRHLSSKPPPPSAVNRKRPAPAEERARKRKVDARAQLKHPRNAAPVENKAATTPLTEDNIDEVEKVHLKDLIGDPDSLKRNSEIALYENKVRMGLNIILMQRMIARADLLLLDMRGTAALIDSLTISAKMSGSQAMEVIATGDKPEVNGDGMKDITPAPKTPQLQTIEDFKRYRAQSGK